MSHRRPAQIVTLTPTGPDRRPGATGAALAGAYRIVPVNAPASLDDGAAAIAIFRNTVPLADPDAWEVSAAPEKADTPVRLTADLGEMDHAIAPLALKQVLVLRRDLKMRRGKEIAQGAHAAMKLLLDHPDDPYVRAWLKGPFTKIAVGIDGEAALLELVAEARAAGLAHALIQDAGRTEFGGRPTLTAAAFGPGDPDTISRLTGHLPLR